MNADITGPAPVAQPAVVLSREELLAVLAALRTATIPGLDPEPSGELTPELAEFAVVIARRALLARGLAQVRADGEFMLQRGLLNAVGACAYPEHSLFAHTWAAGGEQPLRFFGHVRGGAAVSHTRPDPVLHRFVLLDSPAALTEAALAFCAFDAAAPATALDITMPQADFLAAREQAAAGDVAASQAALTGCGASAAAAEALAAAWAAQPRVSVVQTLTAQADRTGRVREFTLTQGGANGWIAAPVTGAAGALRLRATSAAEVATLLAAQ